MDNTAPDRQWVTCPGCAEAFDPDHEAAAFDDPAATVQCPFCSTRFTPTAMQVAPEAIPSPVTPHEHLESTGDALFVVEDDLTDEERADSRDADYRTSRRSNDLSTARIRDLSASRRALIRIRSWCVVGALVSAAAVAELGWLLALHVQQRGWFWKPVLYAALIPLASFWAVYFARRAVVATRELRKPVLKDPDTPPDFSTLSDGSQQWKNLEGM
jgi:hypothetical protein